MLRFLCKKIARILINISLGILYVILGLLPNVLVDVASQGDTFSIKTLLCSPFLIGYIVIAVLYNLLTIYLAEHYRNQDKNEANEYLKPHIIEYFEQGLKSSLERLKSGDYAGAKETNSVISDLVKRSQRW